MARVHPSWGQSESRAIGGEKTQVLCHLGRNSMKFFHLIKAISEFKYASWRLLPIELGMASANSSVKNNLCYFALSHFLQEDHWLGFEIHLRDLVLLSH